MPHGWCLERRTADEFRKHVMIRTRVPLPTTNKKRSLMLRGHKTSISLEDEFWTALHDIALEKGTSVPLLVEQLDGEQDYVNLSSAVRVFTFKHYCNAWRKTAATMDGSINVAPDEVRDRGQ